MNTILRFVGQMVAALALLAGILALASSIFFTDSAIQQTAAATIAGAFFLFAAVLMLGVVATYLDDLREIASRTEKTPPYSR